MAFTLGFASSGHAAEDLCRDDIKVYRNIVFLGFPCPTNVSGSVVPTKTGVEKLIQSFDLLYTKSPRSAERIERLKQDGPVLVVYDPAYPEEGKNLVTTQIAFFLPTFVSFFDKNATGKQYTMFVSRDGIKWPLDELAAVIVHELMGHGNQHLEDRLDTMRPLDVECEAWMLEDVVYQDLGMDKLSQELVDYRQQLEQIHCSDFIRYMRKQLPVEAKLWNVPDLQVSKLLKIFDGYIELQRKHGTIKTAQDNQKRQLAEAIKKAERKNDPAELYGLGMMYMHSIGQTPNHEEAAKWFIKAAKKGHPGAQFQLAGLFEKGSGIEQNLEYARRLFAKSAKAGEPEAFYALGTMFETGTGVPKDLNKARALYKQARPGYDLRYHLIFGHLYRQGIGFEKDAKKAHQFYLEAARLGSIWSQYVVGEMYDLGEGVPEDPTTALRWWWQAAQAGLPHAQNDVANHSLKGRGVPKDVDRAFEYFTKAAEQDYAVAQTNLGHMYRRGIGTEQDDEAAVRWYRKAANHGLANAQYELARMMEDGRGTKQSETAALQWYKKAAAQGFQQAIVKLKSLDG